VTIANPRSKWTPTTRQLAFIEEMKTVLGFGLADFDRWLGWFGVDRVTALDRDGARKVIGALLALQRRSDPQKVGAKIAYIFKPKFPKLRIIRSPNGQPLTETRTAKRGPRKGQRIKVVKREPDRDEAGSVVMLESRKWAIEYTDAAGQRRKAMGFTDKGYTPQKAAAIERGVIRQRAGVVGVNAGHSQTPVSGRSARPCVCPRSRCSPAAYRGSKPFGRT